MSLPDGYAVTVQTAPAAEPVSTADAKTHMRVDISADDTYIATLIKAARIFFEAHTGRAIITQTLELHLDRFPSWEIELPRSPVQSLTSVSYVDSDGVTQTFTDTLLDSDTEPARLTPSFGNSWPIVRDQNGAVTIRYVAGYGSAGSNVPDMLLQGIKILAAHWYENREASIIGVTVAQTPLAVQSIIDIYNVRQYR